MKFKKGVIAAAMTLVLAIGAAGCGNSGNSSSNSGNDGVDVEALLKSANETMAGVKSMSSNMVMDFAISAEDETMDMVMKANMDTIYEEPIKLKMDMDLSVSGETAQAYTMYAVQEGDTMTAYMNIGGDTWYQQPMDISDMSQYNAQSNTELYLENLSGFSAEGTEEINGVSSTIITGVLTGDSMKEAIMSSGMESMTASMGDISEEDIEAIMSDLGDMPVKLWISEDGHVMKYELDMTDMMQKLMTNMMSQMGQSGEAEGITVSKMVISMTCDNFDSVEDFEIPAEALAA
ncbi:hypothetical protein IMSAG049_01779 [Clostridiales bacterium]|nr:hypothetical protein IMSAG049_01779 [Clostridiales bacterium]